MPGFFLFKDIKGDLQGRCVLKHAGLLRIDRQNQAALGIDPNVLAENAVKEIALPVSFHPKVRAVIKGANPFGNGNGGRDHLLYRLFLDYAAASVNAPV